jgi:hypothetical protein
MSLLYVLGNFIGRALISYLVVWLLCLLYSRFNWRAALKLSTRWYSLVALVVLALLGMSATVLRQGGIA